VDGVLVDGFGGEYVLREDSEGRRGVRRSRHLDREGVPGLREPDAEGAGGRRGAEVAEAGVVLVLVEASCAQEVGEGEHEPAGGGAVLLEDVKHARESEELAPHPGRYRRVGLAPDSCSEHASGKLCALGCDGVRGVEVDSRDVELEFVEGLVELLGVGYDGRRLERL